MSTQTCGATGGEPTPQGVDCDLDTTTPRQIRRLLRDLLGDRNGTVGIVVDDAVLVADELVSNAHRHGAAPRTCHLTVIDQGRRLRIEVDDAGADMPRMRTPDRSGGRGLLLVDRLASCWGVHRHTDHKTTWAELALDGAGSSGHARHLAVAPTDDR